MMPMTVPNRPMNGAAEPTVARNGTIDSSMRRLAAWRRGAARARCSRDRPRRARPRRRRALPLRFGVLQLRQLDVARLEHVRDRRAPLVLGLLIDRVEPLGLPERLEEAQRLALRAVQIERLVADHVPADDRQAHEQEEDAAHHARRAEQQLQKIEAAVALGGRGRGQKEGDHRSPGYHADQHASNVLPSRK